MSGGLKWELEVGQKQLQVTVTLCDIAQGLICQQVLSSPWLSSGFSPVSPFSKDEVRDGVVPLSTYRGSPIGRLPVVLTRWTTQTDY